MSETGNWVSITEIPPSERERVRKRLAAGIMKAKADHFLKERPTKRENKPFPPGVDPIAEILKEGLLRVDEVEMDAETFEDHPIDRSFWRDPLIIVHPLWVDGDTETRLRDGWEGRDSYLGIKVLLSEARAESTAPSEERLVPIGRGTAGRPSTARDIIQFEYRRRLDAGEAAGSWRGDARKMLDWYTANCLPPAYPTMTLSGVKQAIDDLWHTAKRHITEVD